MKILVLLIFCCTVQSIPVQQAEVPHFGFQNGIDSEKDVNRLEKKSSEQCSKLLESENDIFEQPSRLSLPTLMTISNEDEAQDLDLEKIVSDMIYHPTGVMLPVELEEMSLMPTLPLMQPQDFSRNSWKNDINYMQELSHDASGLPYEIASQVYENMISPTRLPPDTMQIHESIADVYNYETEDGYNMDNSLYLTPNVRAVRSRDEELLEQLQHEAMMPNIIPTMPVPFLRLPEGPAKYQNSQNSPLMMIMFPRKVSDCDVPFLLDCSPNFGYGKLVQHPYGVYPPIPPAVLNPQYRKGPDTVKNHKVNKVLSKAHKTTPKE